ncbi:MAG TPA: winged helix-turn-helix domain-containing protein [Terriglobales bacterium]|jgi:DNA-binding winged helix-turn-helix (wHTH) protein|nr:winged helix-turn-helix domain-containing protein [Terriglobales bacterium]
MINTGRRLYEFGPFRVDPSHRVLLRDNKPVPLHPKAFDILLVLVERSETVVPKDHLMKAVWPETFVEESNLAQNIFVLRKTLGDAVGENRFIVTVPGRGYRFAEKVQVVDEGESVAAEQDQLIVESHTRSRLVVEQRAVPAKSLPGKRPGLRLGIGLAIVLAVLVGAGVYFYLPRGPKLTEKDTIVLGDFDNKTGDQVFDGTLRQGLSAQLEQSPFLNLLSDSRIAQTLSLMTQPKDSRLSPELAREVCQRTASAAELNGAIAQIGARYLLTLNAVNCSTGESLGSAEAEASNKDHVLDALGKLATQIRGKLGESLASVQKYDVPPADVTTSSLDALHTYSLAMKAVSMNFLTPIRIMQHAIEQDPNFAMAYARLGVMYVNIAETQQGAEAISKAYTLRDRVSEREKLYISTRYDQMVTGDLLAARKDFELFEQIYPRDPVALANLGVICLHLGDFDKLFSFTQASIKLSPRSDIHGSNDIWTYIFLNRFDEAKAMAVSGLKTLPDEPSYHSTLYTIAFVERDFAGMQREAQAYITNPTWGDSALNNEANSAGYFGQLAKAREFTKQAADAARKQEKKETPATYDAEAAIREALAGNIAVAKQNVKTALALSRSKDVEAMSALALALAGDSREATQLATELDRQFPKNTILQLNYLPTIRAAEQLWDGGGRIDPAKAIEMLAPVTPYELGITALEEGLSLYPVYVRGQALLLARNGSAAATEFQKIIQHPGVVQNEPIGALAYLGLARAYALSHDSAQAHAAYQEFFALWKDADPDVPILKQARAEYAKLQ